MEGNYKKWINRINVKLDKGGYIGNAQDLKNDIVNLEGINHVWSPTNRTLTLFDREGNQLSQVSLVSLDNEGTDIRYNASTLSLELYNADNELLDSIPVSSFIGSVGTQLQLNSNQLQLRDSQGNVLSTVSFTVSNIQGLQTALDGKLDKGGYTGTASDLFLNDQNLLQSLQNEQSARYSVDQGLENSKQKKVTAIPITGNITLSEIHNGAILHVTNTCNITIPTGLDANFQCVVYAKGSIIVTFINGGVTINSPSGLLLKTNKMASLFASASNTFNLLGELETS